MQSVLIIHTDEHVRTAFTEKLCENQNIDILDRYILEQSTTIGINDIRSFQKQLLLKPLRSKQKAAIIKNAHLLTFQAQNALLKLLEEPPPETIMLLLADSKENFLPTVLSRCTVRTIPPEKTEILKNLMPWEEKDFGIPKALTIAQALGKSKEEALSWLLSAIYKTRDEIKEEIKKQKGYPVYDYLDRLKKLIVTANNIRYTNATVRLQIEHLLLSLVKK
ncbi:MAG: hypothetical protein HYT10_00300 [Candidatus Levybacteria bacterium]|nr:hypothetical protein [Candidatus Levybacteria bacterium]